jgi:hypothetical protein
MTFLRWEESSRLHSLSVWTLASRDGDAMRYWSASISICMFQFIKRYRTAGGQASER